MPQFTEIFSRNIGAISKEQQQCIQQKRAAVVGCGGLGGHVLEQLVRLGVGAVTCFDPDVFSLSNCNRQLNALQSSMGRNKAEVAVERSQAIHRHTKVISFPMDFREVEDTEAFAVDVAVDCLDDIAARYDLAALCRDLNLPLVHGAVNGWYGQVGVVPPGGDLFARLYPQAADSAQKAPPVLAMTVAVVAALQVSEALKILLALDSDLVNRRLYVDLKNLEFLLDP